MNIITENNFIILDLYPFRKLGNQPENNQCSSNASFIYYTNSITNVLKPFQKTLIRMLTQDELHTETKKTTDHHNNKISVM